MQNTPRKLVLIDFDRTIFDLDLFYHDVWHALGDAHGFDATIALRDIRDYYYAPHDGYHGTYDFTRHIQVFIPDATQESVTPELLKALKGKQFLYDDINWVFEWQKDHEVRILSFGERRVQDFKLLFCPEVRDVDMDIILMHKTVFIAANFAGREGVLIDDKIEHGLPAGIRLIRILRDVGVENKSKSDMIVVNSLKQANTFL